MSIELMAHLQRQKEQQKEPNFDSLKLASARKRLQENYKEAENGLATVLSPSFRFCLFMNNKKS